MTKDSGEGPLMNQAPVEFTPPARFLLFGKALEPLRDGFTRRLAAPPPVGDYVAEPMTWAQRVCDRWLLFLSEAHRHFEWINHEILANEAADESTVQRGIGRLETFFGMMLDEWDALRGAVFHTSYNDMQALLAAALRHNLNQIQEWLDRLIRILTDPVTELRRQGLPLEGQVELDVTLKLTGAPELDILTARMNEANARIDRALSRRQRLRSPPEKRRLGFFDIVLGAALGGFLYDLFDDD